MSQSHLVGLIGSGIGSSLTPRLHESEADALGIRYLYRTIDIDRIGVAPEDAGRLVRAARELGYDALNVTHPCKQTVLSALDELAPDAELLGAVNTVLFRDGRSIGLNTDHSGFGYGLREGLGSPALGRVVLLGSGGAGSAIAFALLSAGAARVSVFDPVRERAEALCRALAPAFPSAHVEAIPAAEIPDAIALADGLVNATPIGMTGHPGIPVEPALLHPGLWVADAVYRPVRTRLIAAAEAAGCALLDGGQMVVGQAADAFRLITGLEPDPERMRRTFLELVSAQTEAVHAQ